MPSGPKMDLDENLMAPELQKYLNRNYWEQKNQENAATKQSAPGPQQSKVEYAFSIYNFFVFLTLCIFCVRSSLIKHCSLYNHSMSESH